MNEIYKPVLVIASLLSLAGSQALAQSSSPATGEAGRQTEKTFQNNGLSQVQHANGAFDRSCPLGGAAGNNKDTLPTSTQDYLGNSGGLDPTNTQLLSPGSVNPAPVGSSNYQLGFPGEGPQFYTGAYASGKYGGILPPTSTGDVNPDGNEPTRDSIFASPDWVKDKPRDMRYYQDDTQYHGTGDPYGFF